MIALALAALIGAAQQTIVVPTTPAAPSQALPATASSPQIKTPGPDRTASGVAAPVVQTPDAPVAAATVPPPKAASSIGASSSSAPLNTRDRTVLPTVQATAPPPSGLPAGVTGGPVFGGAPSIQTGGH